MMQTLCQCTEAIFPAPGYRALTGAILRQVQRCSAPDGGSALPTRRNYQWSQYFQARVVGSDAGCAGHGNCTGSYRDPRTASPREISENHLEVHMPYATTKAAAFSGAAAAAVLLFPCIAASDGAEVQDDQARQQT